MCGKYTEHSTDQTCLRDLQTTNPHDDKARIENAKGGLLVDSYRWVLQNEDFKDWRSGGKVSLLWVQGDAGKGKTMLLCGIIDELKNSIGDAPINVSFCFCQAADERNNNATAVLRNLIWVLAGEQPSVIHHIRKQYDQRGKQLFEDANAWQALAAILSNILEDLTLQDTYVIVDALDECTTDLSLLVDFIARKSASRNARVKWLISSRSSRIIEEYFVYATRKKTLSLELNATSISEAVDIYIHHKVQQLGEKKNYKDNIREAVYHHLLSNAQGTFLWVALVCEELAKASPWSALQLLKSFPPGLDPLYWRILQQIHESEDVELCNRILSVVSTVYRPITLNELRVLVDMSDGVAIGDGGDLPSEVLLSDIIGLCCSFLTLREGTVFFVHKSAKDFLTTKAQHQIFPRGVSAVHRAISSRSMIVMSRSLRRNVYGIAFPGLQVNRISRPTPDPLAAVHYACLYWVQHLQDGHNNGGAELELHYGQCVDTFLQQTYLHWIEALSLMTSVPRGIDAMLRLEGLFKVRDHLK